MRETIARLRALLLDPRAVKLRRREAYPLFLIRVSLQLGKQWAADRCPQIAGALTFQSVLSMVPLMAIASALLQWTGQFSAESALVHYLSDRVFPAIGVDLFEHLNDFVQNVRRGALGPFGVAITVVLSYALFHTIENVFCQIWRQERGRSLLGKFVVFYTLATLLPLLIGLTLYHTAKYWGSRGALLSFASTFGALFLMNKLLPRVQVRWRAAMAGALVSAILFEVAKYVFAFYVTRIALAKYRGVYGTVAIIPILIVWIYVAWLVVLFGAVCAHAAQNLRTLEALDRRARGDTGDRTNWVVALRVVSAIAARWLANEAPLDETLLLARVGLDSDTASRILKRLRAANLVVEVAGEKTQGLLLAHPPNRVLVEDVVTLFRPIDVRGEETAPALDNLLRELETARRSRTGELSIADLVSGKP